MGRLNTYVKQNKVKIPETDTGEISCGDGLLKRGYNPKGMAT